MCTIMIAFIGTDIFHVIILSSTIFIFQTREFAHYFNFVCTIDYV